MRALREFKFQNFADHTIVTVPAGAEISEAAMAKMRDNRIDIDKMVRTRYMEREEGQITAPPMPKKRGRPRKNP